MKAKVDAEKCCGCGPCEEICPEVFEIRDDIAVVKADPVPPSAEATCKEAMANCPSEAITIEE
jgi:ferredoxin